MQNVSDIMIRKYGTDFNCEISILKEKIMLRLVSADAVKEIICKYEQRTIQRTMVYEVEKMPGVSATNEQMVEILGTDDVELD